MKTLRVRFPIVTGVIVSKLKTALTGQVSASGVKVFGKLPKEADRVARMITVRDDSGSAGVLLAHRFGVNVYAESSVSAERIALLAMSLLAQSADGAPITSLSEFVGPVEVEDDNPLLVGGVALANYFFSCRVHVRGESF